MNSLAVSTVVFACVFGGSLLGLFLRSILPQHHLNSDSKDVVRLGMGLIGTMTALLLGLLIASAKSSYDNEKATVTQMAAKTLFLDRVLAGYGPEAGPVREGLHRSVVLAIDLTWPQGKSAGPQLDPLATNSESLFVQLLQLAPQNDSQRTLKESALSLAGEIRQMRWLLYEQTGSSVPLPFLVVVVSWLTLSFISFGLFSPKNPTVMITLLVCAVSVSGAIFLILELDHPFTGIIQISSEPLRDAEARLGT